MTRYNCAESAGLIPSDSDLMGPGVVANYGATAGLALLLLLIYYIAIYEPEQDPFRKSDNQALLPRPNPVDQLILYALRKVPKYILCTRGGHKSRPSTIRYQRAFIKGVLTMSDLQLLTGLSILISGVAQLNQGLQVYYWKLIVYLSWFSTITHLCCLTILRNYLFNHPRERIWRVVSMGCLVIFLLVSLSFTGSSGSENDFALCHLNLSPGDHNYESYVGAILSMVLILFGYVSRLARLHKIVSVDFLDNSRTWLSIRSQRVLRIILASFASESPGSLRYTMIYRPLLTIYLIGKAFLDLWSSMFWEIGWLLIAFLWGIFRLVVHLDMKYGYEAKIFEDDAAGLDWGFGQVAAIFLLLAPLVTLFQCFSDEYAHAKLNRFFESHNHELTLRSGIINHHLYNRLAHAGPKFSESPNNDWNNHSETFGAILIFFILASGLMAGTVCAHAFFGIISALKHAIPLLLPISIGMFEMILFSLMIASTFSGTSSWIRNLFHSFNILFFFIGAIFTKWFYNIFTAPSDFIVPWGPYLFLIIGAGAYILFAIWLRAKHR